MQAFLAFSDEDWNPENYRLDFHAMLESLKHARRP
jgi:hypothetical protein